MTWEKTLSGWTAAAAVLLVSSTASDAKMQLRAARNEIAPASKAQISEKAVIAGKQQFTAVVVAKAQLREAVELRAARKHAWSPARGARPVLARSADLELAPIEILPVRFR